MEKFERFKRHNQRLIEKYEKRCRDSPSQFDKMDELTILRIV